MMLTLEFHDHFSDDVIRINGTVISAVAADGIIVTDHEKLTLSQILFHGGISVIDIWEYAHGIDMDLAVR